METVIDFDFVFLFLSLNSYFHVYFRVVGKCALKINRQVNGLVRICSYTIWSTVNCWSRLGMLNVYIQVFEGVEGGM